MGCRLAHIRGDPLNGWNRHDPRHLVTGRRELRNACRAQVEADLAPVGHHVRPRPAGDRSGVHRHGRPSAAQRRQLHNGPRRRQDRAAPLLRLDTGVRRATAIGDLKVRDPLASAHDVAIGSRTLEHERHIVALGELSNERRAEPGTDLLVGVGHEGHIGSVPGLVESSGGVQAGEKAALHVAHSGSVRAVAVAPERPGGCGPGVENGVHVPNQQEPRSISGQRSDDEIAELRLTVGRPVWRPLDSRSKLSHPAGDVVGDAVHALGRVGAAVDVHERLELSEVALEAGIHNAAQRGRIERAGERVGHRRVSILPAMPPQAQVEERGVELVELRILDGPNRFFTRPAVKLEFRAAAPGPAAETASAAGDAVRRLHEALGMPAPRMSLRRSADDRSATVAYPWRRRTISQAIGAAAARIALGRGREQRELVALRAVALGPLAAVPIPRIPLVAITGTNGKSTTTRLIAHIATGAGMTVGMTNSDGIYLRGTIIEEGDWTGFGGAGRVLAEPGVELAVLETARGGILLRGIGYERNDVSVVTNVSADHLGLQGIDTLDELADTKAAVVRITRRDGWAVLNADDPRVWQMRRETRAHWYPFTLDSRSPAAAAALAAGGRAALLEDGWLVLRRPGARKRRLAPAAELPVTFAGLSRYNVANALAASAACDALGIPAAVIARGLRSFSQDATTNPGRLNLFERGKVHVLVDFAHNEAGLAGLIEVARDLAAAGRGMVRLALGTAGDRTDEILHRMGELSGAGAGEVVICEKRHYLRGRLLDEMNAILRAGIAAGGYARDVPSYPNELSALQALVERSRRGDIVVVMSHVERSEIFHWLAGAGFQSVSPARLRELAGG